MKICNRCSREYPEGRFCLECGGELIEIASHKKESRSGISLGDKNVVAGDIIGKKEEYKITGSTTIIKNDDETRRVVICSVCGKNHMITDSIQCPMCLTYVCQDHFNKNTNRCTNCDNNIENEYRSIVLQILEDGKIDQNERSFLDAKAKGFKIDCERVQAIEKELRMQNRTNTPSALNSFDKIELKKIKKDIVTESDLKPVLSRIERLVIKYPDNVSIKKLYFQIGPYVMGPGFLDKLSKNVDEFYAELAKIEVEILHTNDVRAAIDNLDYVRNQYPEQELDTQGLELDILYRLCEQEGDDYLESVENLLKTILAKNWHESDYAAYVLYRIFSESKLVFRDEILNHWGDNLSNINPGDNTLIQMYLRSAGTKENTKSGQKAVKVEHENEYLFNIYNKGKSDGYFSKYDSYDSFTKYFHDDTTFKKLWDFLKSKGYKVLPFDEFILKIKEKKELDQKVLTETVVQKNENGTEVETTEEDNEFLLQMAGKPTESYSDGYYRGDFKDGLRHGYGQRFWNNGDLYAGDWVNGKENGKGIYTFADGSVYDGEWNSGQKHGHGICRYADGMVYEGQWAKDCWHGNGTLIENKGTVINGRWKNGKLNGKVSMKFTNGSSYEGYFNNVGMNGSGILRFANGSYYDGNWKDNKRNGKGVFVDRDGSYYDGDWKDDKRNGRGIYTYADGRKYEGEFRDDKRNGWGVMTFPARKWSFLNGKEEKAGTWKDDKFLGGKAYLL